MNADPWQSLRRFTTARIALGRAGHAVPVDDVLRVQLAPGQARDAVLQPLEFAPLAAGLGAAYVPVAGSVADAMRRTPTRELLGGTPPGQALLLGPLQRARVAADEPAGHGSGPPRGAGRPVHWMPAGSVAQPIRACRPRVGKA